ncbi:MAG: DUF697 domain-containing protein [Alphaproteobacteria bacterium]|nr:DUF697 domain-containing protein [Alphaproteobacteria bacterium]
MNDSDRLKPGLYDAEDFVPRAPALPLAPPPASLPAIDATPASTPPTPWRRRFLAALGLSIAFFAGLEAVHLVAAAEAMAPGLGWVAGALIGATLVAGGLWARAEIAEFRRIAIVEEWQRESLRLLADDHAGTASEWTSRVARRLADVPETGPGLARFQAMTTHGYAAGDALRLFEREVLAPADRRALAAIGRAVRDSAVGTAASPLAMIDAMIVMVRALRMIRDVAGAYGFRPGGLSALALLRRVLGSATAVAAADIVADVTADVVGGLGHKVVGTVSSRLGVGVFTGMRMARLGVATMRACRPLPFLAEKPQIGAIMRQAIGWAGDG